MSNKILESTEVRRERLAQSARAAREALARPGVIPRLASRQAALSSFAQEEQWFQHALAPADPAYNRCLPLRLSGPLDCAALARALNALVERQSVLRTRYEVGEGGLVARLVPAEPFALAVVDLQSLPDAEREAEVQRLVAADVRVPFDLAKGPVFRAALVRLSSTQHVLLFNVHHIAFDGWSESVLRTDLAALYQAACLPVSAPVLPAALPDLPVQYADYAAWRRGQLEGEPLARQLAYWSRQLAGDLPPTPLPLDRPRTGSPASAGKTQSRRLRPELGEALKELSRQEGATLFMTLLAGFDALLHRYSGEADIIVGVPVAGRSRVELENLIGLFTNSLALRVDLSGQPSVRGLLRQVRRVALEALSHQDLPVSRLVEALRPPRVPGQMPLYQALFQLRNLPPPPAAMGAVLVSRLNVAAEATQIDLTFDVVDQPDGLLCDVSYKTALFDDETITALLADYEVVLSAMAANPDQAVDALAVAIPRHHPRRAAAAMLAEPALAVKPDGPKRPLPPVAAVTALIEEQARRRPGQVAVLSEPGTLTYAELDRRANQLAHYLRRLGVGPERIVAVCLERTPDLIVALLAIHKAGGAYVPLDPAYPPDRLAFMLADSGAQVLLSESAQRPHLPPSPAYCVWLDEVADALVSERAEAPVVAIEPRSLAYMIYTSGSTGLPKGVLIEHRSLLNLVVAMGEAYRLAPHDRLLQLSSLSWDASVEEVFLTLSIGATLVLRTPDMLDSVPKFLKRCRAFGISVLLPATAFWHELVLEADAAMLESLTALRLIVIGGERALPERVMAWQALVGERVRLINVYGPTEATVSSTLAELDHFDAGTRDVPIGRPIANVQAYVLDEQRRPAPPGAIGELYLGGLGVARGYHNQPGLTQARFVPDPFRGEPGARLYRTGDLARYRPDGQLEFHGRLDRQLKLRGYRIEPEEIEAVLRAQPVVREALVTTREPPGGSPVLVAYVVCAAGCAPSTQELRGFLQSRLPQFMLPAALVFLPALPLSLNGKIDLAALPLPDPRQTGLDAGYVAPRNAVERRLVEIWESLLDAQRVGVYDDFFSLGGHSLLAIRVFSQIEAAFHRSLPLALLFESPTIAHLSESLRETERPVRWHSLVPIQPRGSLLPFFCLPGLGGGVMDLAELARLLGDDQPFYGLQPQGLDGVSPPHATIESMAEHYVEVIRSAQPAGPYALGGYCFGGMVAYETARRLQAHGQPVALVAIFEGYAPLRSQAGVSHWTPRMLYYRLRSLPVWLQDFLGLDQHALRARLRYSSAQRFRLRRLGMPLDVDDPMPEAAGMPDHIRRIMELHGCAWRQYLPLPYDGRLTLFNVRFQPLSRTPDPWRGWGRLARGGVDVHMIAGAHYNILVPPQVQSLARTLQKCLAAARAAPIDSSPA